MRPTPPTVTGQVRHIAIDLIAPDPTQPRRRFAAEDLDGLAASIDEVGLLCPILVMTEGTDRYRLVAGERRWRAVTNLGYDVIAAIVIDPAAPLALVRGAENMARVALSPGETLSLVTSLIDQGYPPVTITRALGTSRRLVGYYLQVSHSPEAAAALRAGMALRRVIAEYLQRPADLALKEACTGDSDSAADVETSLRPSATNFRPYLGTVTTNERSLNGAKRHGAPESHNDAAPLLVLGDAAHLPLADGAAACVVTSPPYNVGATYRGYDDSRPWAEYWADVELWAAEMARVLCDGGRAWVCVAPVVAATRRAARPHSGRTETSRVALAAGWSAALDAAGLAAHDQVVWRCTRGLGSAWGSWCSPSAPNIRADHEVVLVHCKGRWRRTPAEGIDGRRDAYGGWPGLASSVWDIPTEAGIEGFAAPYPIELARRAIRLSSWPGELILDPFAGSATTLAAARSLGRRAVGVEISPATVALAARRLGRTSREVTPASLSTVE